DTSFCFVIDSVRMVEYDGVFLQTFFTRALFSDRDQSYNPSTDFPVLNWSHFDYESPGIYTVKTGGMKAGLLPIRLMDWTLFDGVHAEGLTGLRCYKDDIINI